MPSQPAPLPPDDPSRELTVARPDDDQSLPHIGLVGDTYTILVTGDDTAGRYTLIDMHVPPGGGPPPHRHDFEEMFTVLDGEVQVTFRGETIVARAGQTINVPANAPHAFTNAGPAPVRLLCLCAPAGQEEFFTLVGQPVATRTEPPPPLDAKAQAAFIAKSASLAPRGRQGADRGTLAGTDDRSGLCAVVTQAWRGPGSVLLARADDPGDNPVEHRESLPHRAGLDDLLSQLLVHPDRTRPVPVPPSLRGRVHHPLRPGAPPG